MGRGALRLGLIIGFMAVGWQALAEAPIRSAQDAACRDEARDKVFTAPDPNGLGLQGVGRQLYMACMARSQGRKPRRSRS